MYVLIGLRFVLAPPQANSEG